MADTALAPIWILGCAPMSIRQWAAVRTIRGVMRMPLQPGGNPPTSTTTFASAESRSSTPPYTAIAGAGAPAVSAKAQKRLVEKQALNRHNGTLGKPIAAPSNLKRIDKMA